MTSTRARSVSILLFSHLVVSLPTVVALLQLVPFFKTSRCALLHTAVSGSSRETHTFSETSEPKSLPIGAVGPPETLRRLKLGETVKAFRRRHEEHELSNFTIERVSYTPDCFVLRNFLSWKECNKIMEEALDMNMTQAETITNGDYKSRKNCNVAWIPSAGKSPLVSSLVQSTANLMLSPHVLSDPDAGVEDLQVLKYSVGGEFVLHHDGEPRVLTIIYYVNGVGGTWFPLARTSENLIDDPCIEMDHDEMNRAFAKQRNVKAVQNKAQALQIGQGFEPGTHGLLVKGAGTKNNPLPKDDKNNPHIAWIQRGDALAFYNYLDDGSARLDWRALHTGLPTREEDGVKWIANHWFRSPSLTTYDNDGMN